jgi:serine protease AprX
MTNSIGTLDRVRWVSALAAGVLAIVLSLAFLAARTQLPSLQSASGASAPAGSSAPLDPRIASLAAHHPSEVVQTIVQFKAGVSTGRARWDVTRAEGRVFGELHIINALAVKLTARRARWLAANPDVHAVSLNAEIKPQNYIGGLSPISGDLLGQLQTTYDKTLDVTPAWQHGVTGAGVGVAVIDTGIDGAVPDFQSSNGQGSRVVETAVTNPNAQTAGDSYGHGTDVAGIIAGNGLNRASSDPLYGQYIGVAPHADLVSIKVSDESGNATVLNVIYGLQFAVDHHSDYNIRVVNLSLDSTTPQSYKTDPLDAAAESAWMHGLVVVAAAGNRGTNADAVQYAPANDPYVITVGAVDENGQTNPVNDTIPAWSSRGTTQDGVQKPDVYAPGAHIVSVLAPGSTFASICASLNCAVGGAYVRTSGTSMAAPMISGLVADLLQFRPNLTPNQVKGLLISSSVASNPSIQEVDAGKLVDLWPAPVADQGLTPSTLLSGASGNIKFTQSSWSQANWSQATGSLSAGFAKSSWSCTCSATGTGTVGPSQSSWSKSSWSKSSWSTSSWSKSSWSKSSWSTSSWSKSSWSTYFGQ